MTTKEFYWILTDEKGITTEFHGDLDRMFEIINNGTASIRANVDFKKLHGMVLESQYVEAKRPENPHLQLRTDGKKYPTLSSIVWDQALDAYEAQGKLYRKVEI
jgi:hypothetical protein